MSNSVLKADVSKALKNSNLGGSRELAPGATPRRYEPASGVKKHNERIHKESKWTDDNKNLPFTFSKPKRGAKGCVKKCAKCGDLKHVNVNTVGIECKICKSYASLEEIDE